MNPQTRTFVRRGIAALAVAAGCGVLFAQAPSPAAPSSAPSPARAAQPAASAPRAAPAPARPAAAAREPDGSGVVVRALVVAEMDATISSQFAGRLLAMPKLVGDTFKPGDVLVSFDCQERQASVKAAQAEVLGASETHLAKLKLQSLGAVSDLDVTLAAASAEKAKSQLAMAQAQEKYCVVNAPYGGKVVRVRAKPYESVQLGQPLLEIVNLESLRAQMFVPSNWVRWMKPGRPITLAIDETGQAYRAHVDKISGRIDGASQTVEVIARFDELPPNVLPGMIGRARFAGEAR